MPDLALLRIGYANGTFEERALPAGRFRIGRAFCEIPLEDDEAVSALHAALEVSPGQVTIEDLGSRNGTFDANGRRLCTKQRLILRRPIRLGSTRLTLMRLAAVAWPPPRRMDHERSAWQRFREFPLAVQLVLGLYGWWLLLPLWFWGLRHKAAIESSSHRA